jgi:hypothetical protein
MQKRIVGLTKAVKRVLREHDKPLSCKHICKEIKDRRLVDISPEQEEITYGQPKFHHSVRRILTELTRRGEVIRISRGMYMKSKKVFPK